MGSRNVAAAFMAWPGLDDRPMRVLLYMANLTHDPGSLTADPKLYYGGWEALAEVALGRRLPPAPAKTDATSGAATARRARNAADVAVRAAIAALVQAGALTNERRGGRGQRAEYRLNLDPFGRQPQGEPAAKGQGEPAAKGQGEPAPKEQQRNNRGVPTGEHLPGLASHLGDRPGRADDLVPAGFASPAARALLDQALGRVPAGRPPWCGRCHEPTRMRWTIPPDGGELLGRCPDCHPAAVVAS